MDNAWDEITKALSMARAVRYAAGRHANAMADLLAESGTLRKVESMGTLGRLKRELANFNIQTGRWK